MSGCTEDWMTCHVDNDHKPSCGWHPDNVEVTYVSDEVWADITAEQKGREINE